MPYDISVLIKSTEIEVTYFRYHCNSRMIWSGVCANWTQLSPRRTILFFVPFRRIFDFLRRFGMLRCFFSTVRDGRGIAALEYALIAGLMFAAIIGATAA